MLLLSWRPQLLSWHRQWRMWRMRTLTTLCLLHLLVLPRKGTNWCALVEFFDVFWVVKSGAYIFTSLSDFLGPSNPCLTSPYVPVVPLLNQHATLYGGSPHGSRLLLLSRLHDFFNGRFQPTKRADRCFCGFFVKGFRGGSGGCG